MGIFDAIGLTNKITRPRQQAFFYAHKNDAKTLDVGCGNDIYKEFFPNITTVDIEERPGVSVDIIADAHDLHVIEDNSFEIILCAEVLEHLHTPSKAIAEFYRVLKPGGLLLLTTRFVFPLHDAPGDYYRYTKYGLRHLLKDFSIEECKEEAKTVETLAVLFQRIGFQCDTLYFRPFKLFWFVLAKIIMFFSWIITKEYGDIGHTKTEQHILSSGYYVAARKPLS
jgi:predicted SAM-dependent methyltransferase